MYITLILNWVNVYIFKFYIKGRMLGTYIIYYSQKKVIFIIFISFVANFSKANNHRDPEPRFAKVWS